VSLQPHQQRVTDEAAAAAAAGVPYRKLLKWQMGGGKSLGGISVAESLGRPYSVVAPAGVRPTLNAEIARFTDQATPHEVFSYAAAARGRRPAPGTGTLVVDEAQALGSPSARARAVGDMAARADNLILMSGTPVRNDPAEFAPILAALTGRHVSQDDFRRRYVGTEFDRPGGIVGRLLGRPAAEREVLTNQDELKQLLAGKVDYYAPPAAAAAVKDETIETPLPRSLRSPLHTIMLIMRRPKMLFSCWISTSTPPLEFASACTTNNIVPPLRGLHPLLLRRRFPAIAFHESQ
jgi:hypothetical protein